MFDLHSHILPGLDDGAKTMEEAVAMIRLAAQNGTRAILATPHSRDIQETSAHQALQSRLDKLKKEAQRESIKIDVVLGMENHLTPDLPQLVERGEGYSINDKGYILVELPFSFYPDYTEDVLFDLQAKGLTPIIAHPERQASIQADPNLMKRLVERGILGQVTAMSIIGQFGPEALRSAHTLMKRGLVHVIASDAHRPTGPRIPVMSEAVEEAIKIVGKSASEAMAVSNPEAILEGRPVEPDTPSAQSEKRAGSSGDS